MANIIVGQLLYLDAVDPTKVSLVSYALSFFFFSPLTIYFFFYCLFRKELYVIELLFAVVNRDNAQLMEFPNFDCIITFNTLSFFSMDISKKYMHNLLLYGFKCKNFSDILCRI